MQHLRASNDYHQHGYSLHYWRTATGDEVDFVLYGERGLVAIEVKRSARVRQEHLRGLHLFRADYPEAKAYLAYGGTRRYHESGVEIMPAQDLLTGLDAIL